MIYLDNAATTPLCDRALGAMLPFLKAQFGNPGSVYDLGRTAREAVADARASAARFLGCRPDHVIFTSGGSEGNTMVFRGLERRLRETGQTHLVVSRGEHESVLRAVEWLTQRGFTVTWLDIDRDGAVSTEQVWDALRPNTGLLSVMQAIKDLNGRNNVEAIELACREFDLRYPGKVYFHVDAVQSAGAYPIDVESIGCDFLTVSSHKIHGPKGCGALYVRDLSLLDPQVFGGEGQEFGLRSGTENVPAIVGFGAACKEQLENAEDLHDTMYRAKLAFCRAVRAKFAEAGLSDLLHFNSGFTDSDFSYPCGKTVSLRVDGVDSETLVIMLSTQGVYVSSGSACNSEQSKPSRVLLASGLTPGQARETVRFTFSGYNTEKEAVSAASVLLRCVKAVLALNASM